MEVETCSCTDMSMCTHPFTHLTNVINDLVARGYDACNDDRIGVASPKLVLRAMEVCSQRYPQLIQFGAFNDPLEYLHTVLDTKIQDDPKCADT